MIKLFFTLLFSINIIAIGIAGNTLKLNVKGMGGSCCETGFKAKAEKLEGVLKVYGVSASANSATIEYDANKTDEQAIIEQLVKKTDYKISKDVAGTVTTTKSNSCCSKSDASKCTNSKNKSCEKK